jgi:TolB-like protein
MSSIIEGYNYDIFISYRQNDNKYDGWVTEFVDNLNKELEANIKDKISVYFDIDPHDGLLETDSVDKSLENKLKCLIFIPIISRTYCDLKSFAWQHELVAFNKMARRDLLGRDIILANGNVTSRILPVKIHDLDPEDKTQLENELGGQLRGIEFIYREAGVNRPLKPNDDSRDNLNRTSYRNQVNKVANAVKETITALKKQSRHPGEILKQDLEVTPSPQRHPRTKTIARIIIASGLIALGFLLIPKLLKSEEPLEKSIAVLPFFNDSPDEENTHFINGIMEEILNDLQISKNLRVVSRSSVEQYRGEARPAIPKIAKQLDVNYIVEGSGQKYGNSVRLRVQLIEAVTDKHLWAESYEQEIKETKDIFDLQRKIAESIASELKTIITPEEKNIIEKSATLSLTAYDFYLKGNEKFAKYWGVKAPPKEILVNAEAMFKNALEQDPEFARAYVGLAKIFYFKHFWESYYSRDFLDSVLILSNKALSIDDKLSEAYDMRASYYLLKGLFEKAFEDLDKAIEYNPNDWDAYRSKGVFMDSYNGDYVQALDNLHKAVKRERGESLPDLLKTLARKYVDIGFPDIAKDLYRQALKLDEDSLSYIASLTWIEFSLENFEEGLNFAKTALKFDSTRYITHELYICLPDTYRNEAYKNVLKIIEREKRGSSLRRQNPARFAYAFWQVGKRNEAESYFKQQITFGEESIKLGRLIAQTYNAQYDLAATYAFLGDYTKAYQYLDEFSKRKTYPLWWVVLAKHDPLFNSIRNEERFQKILQNMEAKYQSEHERVRKWLVEQGMYNDI